MLKREKAAYLLVALLCVGHYLLGYFAPKQPSAYTFSKLVTILLGITITIPYYLAWFAGCYAGMTLHVTVPMMQEKEDKIAFSRFSIGVIALTASFIAASFVSGFRAYFIGNDSAVALNTILTNYLYTLGPLIGFGFIYSGSGHLRSPSANGGLSAKWTIMGSLLLAAYAAGYLWLIFTNPTRQFSQSATIQASYFLPDSLIIGTLVIPFFASLVLSMLSVFRIAQYYQSVSGVIFKRSAMNFITGSLFVIGGSNLLQALLSLGSSRLLGLGLGSLLLIVYVFLAMTTLGYLYLAFGARKLATIERVMRKYDIKGTGPSV